ncbi:MAG: PilZ domain-containing protein [Candidatus Acidoferrales bacterium]
MEERPQTGRAAVAERRSQQRYPLQFPVEVRPRLSEPLAEGKGRTVDISSAGLYLDAEEAPLQEGSRVELSVRVPAGADSSAVDLRGCGRVVRVDRHRGGWMGLAVEFDQIEFRPDELESLT